MLNIQLLKHLEYRMLQMYMGLLNIVVDNGGS